jgi:hypothetical protein
MEQNVMGSAERIVQMITGFVDHMIHNRPGMVSPDATALFGAKWVPVTHKLEEGQKVVYRCDKQGKKTARVRLGVMQADGSIVEAGRIVGRYLEPGLFPEVVTFLYRQIAEVWKMDNEFVPRWASYEFAPRPGTPGSKDLKVLLAAFLLVQSRKGDPIVENGKMIFRDSDYRAVGEAMMLIFDKGLKGLDPKLVMRIRLVLELPGVAAINRELGFGRSHKHAFLGRWPDATRDYLAYREQNPALLKTLAKEGWRQTIMDLASFTGYKPETKLFCEMFRWKQKQAEDGRRKLMIGEAVADVERWDDLTEEQICQRILKTKPGYKVLTNLVPSRLGMTRAIIAAAIEAGSFSSRDLIIFTPTLEELGLLEVQDIRVRWERANHEADDMRAANIARNVKTKEVKERLETAADAVVQKAVEEVTRGMRIFLIVDRSQSMEGALEVAKPLLSKFVQGFPQDKLHVAVFNTVGEEIRIPHRSAAGVEVAFRGVKASGGTDYGAGVRVLRQYKPAPDEDLVFFFVGDEGHPRANFADAIEALDLKPVAFVLLPVVSPQYGRGTSVRATAARLGIPCPEVDLRVFEDPYAIPRTIRNLLASTPVGVDPRAVPRTAAPLRLSLVEQILKTDLLQKPKWALPATP